MRGLRSQAAPQKRRWHPPPLRSAESESSRTKPFTPLCVLERQFHESRESMRGAGACAPRPATDSDSSPRTARELGDLRGQAGRVPLEHEQPDLVEHRLHRLRRERLPLGQHDLLGRRRLWLLVAVEQLLVQLLAGSPARRSRPSRRDRGRALTGSIIARARSTIFTGSPMSSTNTSAPLSPSDRASPSGSPAGPPPGIVMK